MQNFPIEASPRKHSQHTTTRAQCPDTQPIPTSRRNAPSSPRTHGAGGLRLPAKPVPLKAGKKFRATLETSESALRLAVAVITRRPDRKRAGGVHCAPKTSSAVCRGRRCSRRIDRAQRVPASDEDEARRGTAGRRETERAPRGRREERAPSRGARDYARKFWDRVHGLVKVKCSPMG